MAALRGTVRGMRGEASRLGSKASGLTVSADTWKTFIQTDLRASGAGVITIDREIDGRRVRLANITIDDEDGPDAPRVRIVQPRESGGRLVAGV